MAPRKSTSSTKTAPIPPANASHPARHLIPAALAPGHPHSSSYHSFITSTFYPTNIPASTPPLKKRARTAAPALPELLEAPLEARVLHEKLLGWYDTVKESRAMPWRKDVEVESMSRKERSQRAYEVSPPAFM